MISRLVVAWTFAALSGGGLPLTAQDTLLHYEESLGWSQTPVTNAILDQRIASAARQYRAYAPIPRAAFYDLALSKDSLEYLSMKGFGVMVLTVIVQDSAEIIPQQVYLATNERRFVLEPVAAVSSRTADSLVARTFGAWRFDAMYLAPVAWRPATLLVDFVRRRGFRLDSLGYAYPAIAEQLPRDLPSAEDAPRHDVVQAFMTREYPGLTWLWQHR
jgi:hypothetical protein